MTGLPAGEQVTVNCAGVLGCGAVDAVALAAAIGLCIAAIGLIWGAVA